MYGGLKSGMNKNLLSNVFDNAVMTFTDSVLMLMFGGSKSGSYFLFGCPVSKNGRFKLGAGISVYAFDGVRCDTSAVIGNEVGQSSDDIRA